MTAGDVIKLVKGQHKIHITVETPPDELGKQRFTIRWRGYNPSTDEMNAERAQMFHANLNKYIENYIDKGYEMRGCDNLSEDEQT